MIEKICVKTKEGNKMWVGSNISKYHSCENNRNDANLFNVSLMAVKMTENWVQICNNIINDK